MYNLLIISTVKTLKKITSILFVAAAMMMAACDPYDDQFPIPSDEYINDVNQTSWVYEERDTYEDENGMMPESVETDIIAFKSTASGKFSSRYANADRNNEETIPFTYTYKRPNGTITITADGQTETLNFSYNAEKEMLTPLGSEGYSLMFSRLRTAK